MRQRRPKTVEQLEACIRQEWDNVPIPKLEQLVSSVPRRLQTVPTFLRCVDAMKFKISTYFSLKIIHFLSLNIWYVIYVVFWIKYWNLKLPHAMHSVFIHNLYNVPTFLESGLYFRYILLIWFSRGANNCVQSVFEKNIYSIIIFPPHFKLLLSNERLDFCEFFK